MSGKRSSRRTPPDVTAAEHPETPSRPASCVVGVGASAGGLEALSQLLAGLPGDTGMGFVLLQHLDPKHPSLLTHLLSDKTSMAIAEAADGDRVAADRIYVVPPGVDVVIDDGRLKLTPRRQTPGVHLPIDGFLRSLAADQAERAIGVIVSGAGSDGAQGLAAVKSEGGVTFAQEPSTAEYQSMPANAIDARAVDFVLPPGEMGAELARLTADGALTGTGVAAPAPSDAVGEQQDAEAFDEVFALLHAALRVDFSAYKLPTIRRRIARRMLVRRTPDLTGYVRVLRQDPDEVEALYRDILIMVTEFFRDPETFAVLRKRVFPALLQGKNRDTPVRVWVPGCASGEEAYSLAIALREVMAEQRLDVPVKIFATDISEPDLEKARRGAYAENIATTVAPELLQRYFTRTESGYQIAKTIRELCVFARHDVTHDPPFANLDLVSCRNLLIYLGSALQRRVLPSLHYGLRSDGYLVLGRSESIGSFTQLFVPVDKKHKIFKKSAAGSAVGLPTFPTMVSAEQAGRAGRARSKPGFPDAGRSPTVREEADRAVLATVAQPGVTVDSNLVILEFRGETAPFLKNRPGRPSHNLLDMVRDELAGQVRAALAEAQRTGLAAALQGVRLNESAGEGERALDLKVIPFDSTTGQVHYVVLFEAVEPSAGDGGAGPDGGVSPDSAASSETERLRDELDATRERLEAVIEDKEAANEELRAANEEMLSSGEEMQSINEELETTQEELQSTNQELRSRNAELGEVSDDLSNLITSVSFPIVMVGTDLRIRRFTPAAGRLLNVMNSDVGRLITDLRLCIDVPDLDAQLAEVIETIAPKELDVQDDQGRWYEMQLRPYKTADNRIDGAVLTLFDIDEMTRRFATQQRIALTLQQSFIHPLPELAGVELAVAEETAYRRDLVGGDFHDVFRLPDGKVLIFVGDVAGKGVEATGLGETVRVAVRATALLTPLPSRILANVHDLVADISEQFVTALLVLLDPATGEAVMASAGHPPPVHVRPSGCSSVEADFGTPLGAFVCDYPEKRFSLQAGDALVLYTDGVVEAHRGVELFGEERLIEVLGGVSQPLPRLLVDRLRNAVVEFADDLKDDLQVVALRLP